MRRQIYERSATHTRVRLTFYPFDGGGFSGVVDGSHPEFGHVVACTTNKTMGAAKGTFQITVKKPQAEVNVSILGPGEGHLGGSRVPSALGRQIGSGSVQGTGAGNSWLNMWPQPEGTWVLIQWVCDGQVIDGMLGQIDAINETTARSGLGTKSETYSITGSGFGKVLETTNPYISIYDDPANIPLGPLMSRLMVAFKGGSPGEYVEALIEAWIGNYGSRLLRSWLLPSGMAGSTFYDILEKRIGCKVEGIDGLLQNPNLVDLKTGGGKNLWALLTEHANLLMNELYVDLAPPVGADPNALTGMVPTVFLRRKPFKTHNDARRWSGLVTHHLQVGDIQNRTIAKGGPAARFNYWTIALSGIQQLDVHSLLHGSVPGETGYPGGFPIWNLGSIEKHGFRLYHQSSNYLPLGDSEGNIAAQAANWLRRLHDWHSVAPFEMSGTIATSRVLPEIRIGQRVKEHHSDGTIEYYVEGVVTAWNYGGPGTTKITVTRGEYEGQDNLEAVYHELDSYVSGSIVSAEGVEEFSAVEGDGTELTDGTRTGEGITAESSVRFELSRGTERSVVSAEEALAASDAARLPLSDDFSVWSGSPSEADADRAFNNQPEQTINTPEVEAAAPTEATETTADFDEEALESGAPIPTDPLGGIDPSFHKLRTLLPE